MSVRIVEREWHEKGKGYELGQYLAGCIGAVATTLPSLIVTPLWAVFVANYRVVDGNGEDDDVACGAICFLAGLTVWAAVVAAVSFT